MKFTFEKLGALDYGELDLADLTVVCGENNSGKTYVAHAIYGWMAFMQPGAFSYGDWLLPDGSVQALRAGTAVQLDLRQLWSDRREAFWNAADTAYRSLLPEVLAVRPEMLAETRVGFAHPEVGESVFDDAPHVMTKPLRPGLALQAERFGTALTLGWVGDPVLARELASDDIILVLAGMMRGLMCIDSVFPVPFVASAERADVMLFREAVNLARARAWQLPEARGPDAGLFEERAMHMPGEPARWYEYAYPWSVRNNLDLLNQLQGLVQRRAPLLDGQGDLLDGFEDIVGGQYSIGEAGVRFAPRGSTGSLGMSESSSSVRALAIVGLYLRHLAAPGDLFMIDEPELNLHPANQRRFARLLARLVNAGVKVFMTTHSDYIVKEFNTLLMLGQQTPHTGQVREKHGYRDDEPLTVDQVKLYTCGPAKVRRPGEKRSKRINTLTPAPIDAQLGIEVATFDATIDAMNEIQDELL